MKAVGLTEYNVSPRMDDEDLYTQYLNIQADAEILGNRIAEHLTSLLHGANVLLNVPIQHRTKTWPSVVSKIERTHMPVNSVGDVYDLVGLRVIVQFRSDLSTVAHLIRANFSVQWEENAQNRLGANQFGYSSVHFVIVPVERSMRPATFISERGLVVEIQVRTAAQHIWATASHLWHYKRDADASPALRRAISRVAALLETADSELDNLMRERYVDAIRYDGPRDESPLTVDLLQVLMDEHLPPQNKDDDENYRLLHGELVAAGISTVGGFREMVREYIPVALAREHESVRHEQQRIAKYGPQSADLSKAEEARVRRGVFTTHVGLVRYTLSLWKAAR